MSRLHQAHGVSRFFALLLASAFAIAAMAAGAAHGEAPLRAAIRGDGTLLVNGKPVFPIGVRTEKIGHLRQIADAGFNLVMGSGEWGLAHYREAHRRKLMIFAGHYVWASFSGTAKDFNLRARNDALVRNMLTRAKDQSGRTLGQALRQFDHLPGIIGWKTGDEPEAKLTELVEAAYEIIKSHNPSRVVGPITCDRQWLRNLRNGADVLILDNYPLRGSYKKKYLTSINETYLRMARTVKAMQGKAAWYMPPMYPYSYWSNRPKEDFTLRDTRLTVYAGLIAGAKGIVFYHWGLMDKAWMRDKTGDRKRITVGEKVVARRLGIMKSLAGELRQMGPMICDGRPNDEPDIRWIAPGANGPGPQLTRVIEYDGKQHLLVMNLLDVPIKAMVFCPNPAHYFRAYDAAFFVG